jgi:hypothetical protein
VLPAQQATLRLQALTCRTGCLTSIGLGDENKKRLHDRHRARGVIAFKFLLALLPNSSTISSRIWNYYQPVDNLSMFSFFRDDDSSRCIAH